MAGLNIKDSFQIDAAKLLAKLHRGACETHEDMMFFNSGVLDDEKIAPAGCEKSKISFNTKLTQCELGVVAQPEIECKLKHTADDILDKATEVKQKEDEKSKITDNPDQKTNESGVPSFMQFLREDDEKKQPTGDQKKDAGDIIVDPFQVPKDVSADAKAEVEKMVKENQDELKKVVDNAVKNSVQYLQHYMKVFAGDAEAKKISDKTVVTVYLPDGADPFNFEYKDGAIEGVSESDRVKAWHEMLKKDQNVGVYVIKNLCCKIAYSLNMES